MFEAMPRDFWSYIWGNHDLIFEAIMIWYLRPWPDTFTLSNKTIDLGCRAFVSQWNNQEHLLVWHQVLRKSGMIKCFAEFPGLGRFGQGKQTAGRAVCISQSVVFSVLFLGPKSLLLMFEINAFRQTSFWTHPLQLDFGLIFESIHCRSMVFT